MALVGSPSILASALECTICVDASALVWNGKNLSAFRIPWTGFQLAKQFETVKELTERAALGAH